MIWGTILHEGEAQGEVLVLTEPLSFWGAFDPRTGKIVDIHHPQCGLCVQDRILMLPETRGSGTAPGSVAEALRRGTGPRAIIMIKPDINVAIGAAVASQLYEKQCPIIAVSEENYKVLSREKALKIAATGVVTVV